MPKSKLKNLIILILAAVCLFLLILVVPTRLEALHAQQESFRALQEVFHGDGVALDFENLPRPEKLYSRASQFEAAEKDRFAAALLGEQVLKTDELYRSHYRSKLGSCDVGLDGSCRCTLLERPEAADEMGFVTSFLQRIGYAYFSVRRSEAGGSVVLHAVSAADGFPVLRDFLDFEFEGGKLASVSGHLIPQGSGTRLSRAACCSAQDALIAFRAGYAASGFSGTRIYKLQQGYYLPGIGSDVTLQPAWQIETDAGQYLVDGITKNIIPLG